jgi:hypothetical protein
MHIKTHSAFIHADVRPQVPLGSSPAEDLCAPLLGSGTRGSGLRHLHADYQRHIQVVHTAGVLLRHEQRASVGREPGNILVRHDNGLLAWQKDGERPERAGPQQAFDFIRVHTGFLPQCLTPRKRVEAPVPPQSHCRGKSGFAPAPAARHRKAPAGHILETSFVTKPE